jgi:hypothetical protein
MQVYNKWAKCQLNEKKNVSKALVIYIYEFIYVFVCCEFWVARIKGRTQNVIQIDQLTRCNNFSSLLLDVYVQLNMFRVSSRPSLGAQQLQ